MIRLPRLGPKPRNPALWRRIGLWALALLVAGLAFLDVWSRRMLLLEMDTLEGGVRSLRLEGLLMPLQPEEPNASDALSAACALARLAPGNRVPLPAPDEMALDDPDANLSESQRAALEIPEHHMALELLDRAAGLSYSRYLEASADAPGLTILQRRHVHERISVIRLARLLRLRAYARVTAGEPEAAYQDVATLLRLSRWTSDELPVLFSGLLSVHLADQALESWEQLATHTPLPEPLVPELGSALESHLALSAGGRLEGERAFIFQMMQRTGELMLATGGSFDPMEPLMRIFGGWYLRFQTLEHLRAYNALVTWSQAPPWQRPALDSLYEPAWPFAIPVDLMVPNLKDAVKKNDRLRARLEMARLAMAHQTYFCREGVPPETLNRLVPGDLAALPLDPWSGDPISRFSTSEGTELRAGADESALFWRLVESSADCPGPCPD